MSSSSDRQTDIAPEVEPVSQMLADTFLRDPKFLTAAIVGGLALILFLNFGRSRNKASQKRGKKAEPNVVLLGSSDSGKTAIFTKLVHDETIATHTSLKPSTGRIVLPETNKSITISDIPGHPRLKESVQDLVSQANAAVFVVDIATLIRNGPQVAEELPNILTRLASTSLTSSHLPAPKLLILAHKADLLLRTISNPNPKPTPLDDKTKKMALERAKTVITREMERLKSARGTTGGKIEGIDAVPSSSSSGLLSRFFGTSSSSGEKPTVISEQGMEEAELMLWGQSGRFSWDEIEGVDVDWAVSGLGNASDAVEDGLDELKDWLSEL